MGSRTLLKTDGTTPFGFATLFSDDIRFLRLPMYERGEPTLNDDTPYASDIKRWYEEKKQKNRG
jgi:hypothetical protein